MPITAAKMASNTAEVTLQIGEDTVTTVYYPSRITEKVFAQLQLFTDATEDSVFSQFGTLNDLLCHLIKSWDVLNEDGSMYPLEPDALADLPFFFRTSLIQAIMSDIRPETLAPQVKTLNS